MIRALLIMIATGCAVATVTTDELDYSALDIQKAIVNTLGVSAKTDDFNSGKRFESKPFRIPIGKKVEPVRPSDTLRAFAKIAVVGDRRPYVVDVTVALEEKDGQGEWSSVGRDKRLARQLADQIQDYLARHKEKNLIDHFRPF